MILLPENCPRCFRPFVNLELGKNYCLYKVGNQQCEGWSEVVEVVKCLGCPKLLPKPHTRCNACGKLEAHSGK